ncbi:hypothetical protein ACIHCX_03200 [Streptomyces sp. NPDC052043]|uniref:hypothetical protein n=1 Tax=Streptomyces sp. NPDC052043 TaxID=3365684 RepID=UPI0037CFAD20
MTPVTAKCAGCGRPLKRPSPTGFGPVCWRRLNGRPARQPAPTPDLGAPVPHVDGQTEIDLIHHQPTLWSL